MEKVAEWAEAANRVAGFLAGCRDYRQSAELAADLTVLTKHGLDRTICWRGRVVSARRALGSMSRREAEAQAAAEAERARQSAAFKAAYRPAPALARLAGRGIGGWTSPAERARREANRAARAEANRAMAKGFGCGKRGGSPGKRRAA